MDIGLLFRDLINYGLSQEFINRRFKSSRQIPLPYSHIRLVELDDGSKFQIQSPEDLLHCLWVWEDYRFENLKKEDIVIDLGANCGGFCIPSSKLSDHVFAVEPLFADRLRENIALNKAEITIIETALGDGKMLDLKYMDRKKTVQTSPFSYIKEITGGCDFLKCDCEGAEHFLTPDDLSGVRRIEMEIHRSSVIPWNYSLFKYIRQNYSCEYKRLNRIGFLSGIMHATLR